MSFTAKSRSSSSDAVSTSAFQSEMPAPHGERNWCYKRKADTEQRLITHITSGEKAKFPDGHEEEHKIIKTKDMNEIKNVVDWILSL